MNNSTHIHIEYSGSRFEYFLVRFADGPIPTILKVVSSRTRPALSIPYLRSSIPCNNNWESAPEILI